MGKIIIAPEEWDKFEHYTDLIDKEIACFGYCKQTEDGNIYVDHLFLVPQEVSGTSVDFTSEGLAFAVNKAIEDDRVEDMKFCIHSHVNMSASFSNIDHDMVKDMGKTGTPWFASVIFNKKREVAGRIDMFELPVAFDRIHIEVEVEKGITDELLGQRISEIEEYVSEKKYTAPKKDKKNKGSKGSTPHTSSKFDGSDDDLVKAALEDDNIDFHLVYGRGNDRGTIAYFWSMDEGGYLGEVSLSDDQEKDLLDAEWEKDASLPWGLPIDADPDTPVLTLPPGSGD